MTIQEAIKSGKRFKRSKETTYYRSDVLADHDLIRVEDVMAIDWEVEEKKFEITEKEIKKMIEELRLHSTEEFDKQIIEELFEGGYK